METPDEKVDVIGAVSPFVEMRVRDNFLCSFIGDARIGAVGLVGKCQPIVIDGEKGSDGYRGRSLDSQVLRRSFAR
jgi:hypothetical protein